MKSFFLSRNIFLLLFPLFAALSAILYNFDPAANSGLFPPCPFHYLTGYYCCGCGSLRAMHQLLHGNILSAARYNVLMVAFLPILSYEMFILPGFLLAGVALPHVIGNEIKAKHLIIIIITYWILRNIPFAPFTLLAPHL